MDWQKPEFEEINMSAEIGGYQEEEGGRYPLSAAAPALDAMPRPENTLNRDSETA
ncbi:MAG: hypothetical protein JWM16_6471 [Verrucomicrobiales bacterium]|nr:hypothetical protein [Verrucomicrobiales bacterium]